MLLAALAASAAARAPAAHAQRAVDAQVGTWAVSGSNPAFYSGALWRTVAGPLGYGLRGFALAAGDTAARSLYGLALELTLFRGRGTLVPYGVGGAGLALATGDATGVAAVWSAGVGLEWNPVPPLAVAVEARRLLEDRDLAGFWNLAPDDRRGWATSARVSLYFGRRAFPRRGAAARAEPVRPARPPDWLAADAARPGGAAEPLTASGARVAAQVVETALAVMGQPYVWGGTQAEEGFDCSGLIYYAYTTHGIAVPRVSRDQARVGRYVLPEPDRLEPGDILLFAARPDAVTHVGLYIGNGKFIHATSSGGVRVGTLDPPMDANDRWWVQRWVGARRVLR